ncbi:MAG TPA: hypothetical protein VFP84_03855 [Kofleriaceae bacterium]|nr:hypothetical protein [Kofleriaceae bacterium]
MGEHDHGSETDDNDEDRAELEWLIARESAPDAPPPSPEVAAQHARLEALLRSVGAEADQDSWHAGVMKQIEDAQRDSIAAARAARRKRLVRWTLSVGAIAVAAGLLFVLLPRPAAAVELQASIQPAEVRRGDAPYAKGDRLIAKAPAGDHDLRVYRPDGSLQARCPDGPACTTSPHGMKIEIVTDMIGTYRVLLVVDGSVSVRDEAVDAFVDRATAEKHQLREKTFSIR